MPVHVWRDAWCCGVRPNEETTAVQSQLVCYRLHRLYHREQQRPVQCLGIQDRLDVLLGDDYDVDRRFGSGMMECQDALILPEPIDFQLSR